MSYDEELASRLRAAFSHHRGVSEKRMFGGLAFLVNGHMAITANRNGALMVRLEPTAGEAMLGRPGVAPVHMRGRSMSGWLLVEAESVPDEAALAEWVDLSLAFVTALEPK